MIIAAYISVRWPTALTKGSEHITAHVVAVQPLDKIEDEHIIRNVDGESSKVDIRACISKTSVTSFAEAEVSLKRK